MLYFEEDIIEAIQENDINKLKKIIKENPTEKLNFNLQEPLFEASYMGNLEIVKYLLSFEEVYLEDNQPMYHAALFEHLEVLKFYFNETNLILKLNQDEHLIKSVFNNKSFKSALYLFDKEFYKNVLLNTTNSELKFIYKELLRMEKINNF